MLLIGTTSSPAPEVKVVRQTPNPVADQNRNIQVWAQTGAQVAALRVNGSLSLSGALSIQNTVRFSSGMIVTRDTNIGWSVQSGANQACNTTCVNACVLGQDTSTIVSCSDATADRCLCAGGF